MSSGAVETLSSPRRSLSPLLPKSDLVSPNRMSPVRRSSRAGRENTPPPDPNVKADRPISPLVEKKSPSRLRTITKSVDVARSMDERTPDASASSVKVFARIRPIHDHEKKRYEATKKVSADSVMLGERSFTFNSVMGPESSQEDVFRLIGLPMVRDSMAGYNTSIISYGESGSGKTYTMWGPLSAMLEENSTDICQGIAPRMFQALFEEIQKVAQESSVEEQTSFQCRCSFLEIHNDQLNDLLDTTRRNLQVKDDTKNGFYVENLTEEYVTTSQDVIQIILKGLSSRRVGTTSMNSKSSRSHVMLTCLVESWCTGKSTRSFSNSKISRISLVDLAGSDRNKVNDEDRHYTKEGRQVHKSLSSLGKLVNVLAGADSRSTPYADSCLTSLMRESLGGNAKTAFICTVSPDASRQKETLRTLRFAQQVKRILNKPMVNEITEDHVDDLTDQIRHLKEELIREKSNQGGGHMRVEKARQSLSLLRASLNRSLASPPVDHDSEEEQDEEINEEDVSQLCEQLGDLNATAERNLDEPASSDSPKLRCSVKRSEVVRSSVGSKNLSPTDSLAASLQRGLQAIESHRSSTSAGAPLSFSFDHLISKSTAVNSAMQIIPFTQNNPSEVNEESLADVTNRKNELENICKEQAAKIDELNLLVEKYKSERDRELRGEDTVSSSANVSLLQLLRDGPARRSSASPAEGGGEDDDDIEAVRARWNESESRWICLADELRIDLESQRRLAESRARELAQEQSRAAELDDALRRAMLSHAKLVEHYAELQETHGEVLDRHRRVMQGVAQVKRAAARAGAGGAAGSVLAEALAAELSSLRVERERETAVLKKQNRGLRLQLKDTAEAVHAAGELLVRLREAEQAAAAAEGKREEAQGEAERLRKQMRKMKEKHSMEMETVKHCLANSRLPESALEPLFRSERGEDAGPGGSAARAGAEDDESWRAAFVPAYE